MKNADYGIKRTKRQRGFYALQVGSKEYSLQSPEFHGECSLWILSDMTGNEPTLHFECKKFALAHLAQAVLLQEHEARGGKTKIIVTTK